MVQCCNSPSSAAPVIDRHKHSMLTAIRCSGHSKTGLLAHPSQSMAYTAQCGDPELRPWQQTHKVQALWVGRLQAACDEVCGEGEAGLHAVEVNQRLQRDAGRQAGKRAQRMRLVPPTLPPSPTCARCRSLALASQQGVWLGVFLLVCGALRPHAATRSLPVVVT